MERRSFLLGGVAAGVTAVAGVRTEQRVRPGPPAPRSARPYGGRTGELSTRVVWHAGSSTTRVALTLDDGPSPRWTPQVLDLLAHHGARATFFVVGAQAQRHPDLVRRAVDEGHEIASHTWSHADLTRLSPDAVRDELERTSELLAGLTGRPPALVRPPWGHIDAVGLLAAAELGAGVVMWSELVRASHAADDLAATLHDVRPGSVVLAHDGGPTPSGAEMRALEDLLRGLTARGQALDTVSGLLDDPDPDPTVALVAHPSRPS